MTAVQVSRTVRTVGELRAALEGMRDQTPLLVQVVAKDGSAWTLDLGVTAGADAGFKWAVNPAILTASHPELLTLSASGT
jgi:hypothetical protein